MRREALKDGLNNAWIFAKRSFRYTVPLIMLIAGNKLKENSINEILYSGNVSYDDTVRVISNCGMFSSDKSKAIKLLKRNETPEYYKAIIVVLKSNMFSCDKILAIQNINSEE